jgi:hypothetical protein
VLCQIVKFPRVLKKFHRCMTHEGSSLCSHQPGNFLYHEPVHTMLPFFCKIFYSCFGLPTDIFPSAVASKTNTHFSPPPPYMPHAQPISPFLFCPPEHQLVRSTLVEGHITKFSPFFCFFGATPLSGPGSSLSRGF